jgi:hypothetical protein
LGLLDETVQNNQHAIVKAKYQSCDALAGKGRSNLPKTVFKASHERHANGPAELYAHEINSNDVAVENVQTAEPLAHRFPARGRTIELNRYFWGGHVAHLCLFIRMYQK